MTFPAYALAAKAQMSVSPRLQQAVRLLQMSALEFQQELQNQLVSNPFLEEADLVDASGATLAETSIDGMALDSPASVALTGEPPIVASDAAGDSEGLISNDVEAYAKAEGSPADADLSVVDGTSPESLEWNELSLNGIDTPSQQSTGSPETDSCSWISAETGLREHLHEQVCGAGLGERERLAAVVVIESLDDDGYLRDGFEETSAVLDLAEPLDAEEMQRGLRAVQQFDPVGVAARDLPECLTLQLQALPADTPGRQLAFKIVNGQLEVLAKRDYGALQRRLDCSEPALLEAHALIRRLDPKPGLRFSSARTQYVIPDILIVPQKGKLTAVINPAVMPRTRLNRQCVDLLRRVTDGKYPAMKQQLQEARWFLRNAEQRNLTIKRVADAIVARQPAFFQYGEIALKPLMLREVADELNLHESTLSRATGNKFMATPRGVFEFKHFFSRQLHTDTGGTCSATAVRALIREMIDAESREAPLSDVSLAKMLSDHGICVARRTVAKYRNQMKVPPAELRYLP